MQNNILNYLYQTVQRVPEKTAFSDGTNALTFRQVYEASRSVGSFLCGKGFCKRPVVVFMRRSPDEVAAFLGAIAGGCFYVPVDEEMPSGRIQLILDNVKPPLVICDESTEDAARTFRLEGGEVVRYSEIRRTPARWSGFAAAPSTRTRSISSSPPAPPAYPRGWLPATGR